MVTLWLMGIVIGSMVDLILNLMSLRDHLKDQDVGLSADRLYSEMLRGFCDRQTDRQGSQGPIKYKNESLTLKKVLILTVIHKGTNHLQIYSVLTSITQM